MLEHSQFLAQLVAQGVVSPFVLDELKQKASQEKHSLVAILLEQPLIDTTQIAKILAQSFAYEYLDLDHLPNSAVELSLLSEKMIREQQLLPLRVENHCLQLAIADPTKTDVLAEIQFRTHWQINIIIVDVIKLTRRIAQLLHLQEKEQLHDEAPIVGYVEKLLFDAANKKASDIHLEPYADYLRVRWRIDGLLYEMAQLPLNLAPKLMAHVKVLAQLDIAEKRLPQDGRFLFRAGNHKTIDCRLSVCPTVHGEKIVIRLLNAAQKELVIDRLGMTALQQELFLQAISRAQGMILVTGPTGSGKTVTLYTALSLLNQTGVNISTVEDPVEIQLSGINQVAIQPKIGLDFAQVLRAFLRQDPDVMMIGEMRDEQTADIAVKAAQTGHLVLSTLHTNSCVETIVRLQQLNIAPYQIASALHLIIAQRLVRCLCAHCKTPDLYKPAAIQTTIYRAVGCSQCQEGYVGRTAIYEMLPINETLAQMIVNRCEVFELLAQAKKQGLQTLAELAMEKVCAGVTSLAEMERVIV